MHKFFLDKLIKKDKEVDTSNATEVAAPSKEEVPTVPPQNSVNGIDYYQHPIASDLEIKDDLSELDKYEQQLQESSEEFLAKQEELEENEEQTSEPTYDQDDPLEDDMLF